MAYCGPKGIPLSTFLSWSLEDQQAALAWQAHEGRRCPSCGSHPEDFSRDGDERHFHVSICAGCMKHKAVADSIKDAKEPGLHVIAAHGPTRDCPTCNPKP